MNEKGYIGEFMSVGRIVSHGQITDLTDGFSLSGNVPFSVYVRPKASISNADILLNVRCYQDDDFSPVPIGLNDWTPLSIIEIAPNPLILDDCEIYWGSGCEIHP